MPTAPIDIAAALAELRGADATWTLRVDRDGCLRLGDMGETQLEAVVAALMKRHPDTFAIEAPRVVYIETLGRKVDQDYTFKRQVDGRGRFARVRLVCAPSPGLGNRFESEVSGGAIPAGFVEAVDSGVAEALEMGGVAGFQVVDVNTTLVDGAYHDTDSSPETFAVAAREAVRAALADGGCVALEPVMSLEVRTPALHADKILQDLVARRGVVVDQHGADRVTIAALVPLANLLGYATHLRAVSHGTAEYAMAFAKYQPLPGQDDEPPPAAATALRA